MKKVWANGMGFFLYCNICGVDSFCFFPYLRTRTLVFLFFLQYHTYSLLNKSISQIKHSELIGLNIRTNKNKSPSLKIKWNISESMHWFALWKTVLNALYDLEKWCGDNIFKSLANWGAFLCVCVTAWTKIHQWPKILFNRVKQPL